jgi:membrane-associated phospholipid phosphatase
MAAALTEETGSAYVGVIAYSAASVIGWSRISADEHWLSDVVGGALLGTLLTQGILRSLHDGDDTTASSQSPRAYVTFTLPARR